jgi:hypothetical protein
LLGRYSVKRMILTRGRAGKLTDWIDEMARAGSVPMNSFDDLARQGAR